MKPGSCLLVLSTLALLAGGASAQGPSLLDYELRSLQVIETHELQRYQGKPLLMLFFQPQCSWCLRQARVINRLFDECPGAFHAVAVGVNGDRRELKQELRRLRPDFPAYETSPALLESIGGIPATPFSLLGDARGELTGWLRGFIPEEQLRPQLCG